MYLIKKPPIDHPLNIGVWPFYLIKWHVLFYIGAIGIYLTFVCKNILGNKTTDRI